MDIGVGSLGSVPNQTSLSPRISIESLGWPLTVTSSSASEMICGGNGNACHDISGATAQNYQVKSDDAGNTLRVRVIAGNADGSNTATS